MGKLDGKIALITGGSEGIGLATAQLFVEEGAYVFITGRRQDALDTAIKQVNKNIRAIQGDVSKLDDIDNVYKVIQQEKGKLDIVFANAGISSSVPLESVTEKNYDDVFNINVKGLLFTVQKSLPILNDGASIILNATRLTNKGRAGASLYCASKAAVRSFARCWCVDLKDRKIRVNVVSPGPTDTPLFNNLGGKQNSKELTQQLVKLTVLDRVAQPIEVAKPVLFLASDDSSYITGIELFVDGGASQI